MPFFASFQKRSLRFKKTVCLICVAGPLAPVYCNPFQERLDSAQKPDWLTMGSDLTPEIVPLSVAAEIEFRDPFGGAKLFVAPLTNLEIDGVRVESAPDDEPRANRASLNPDRSRLIITRGMGPFYVSAEVRKQKVTVDWENRQPLPEIYYGKPPRFRVVSWVWLDDITAISPGVIDTEDQHNYAQVGLFIFEIASKTMRRVDLKELDIEKLPTLMIKGVNPDKRMIRITLDDEDSSGNYRKKTYFLKIPGE